MSIVKLLIKCKKYFLFKTTRVHFEELGRQAGCASASSALPPPSSSSRVVNKCRAVSQTGRLQQEETGLNRCEQLPTAALALITHSLCDAAVTTNKPVPTHTDHQLPQFATVFIPFSTTVCIQREM